MSVTDSDIYEALAFSIGWSRTMPSSGSDQENLFYRIMASGLDQFENPPVLPGERVPHQWSFLFPAATIQLTPAYSTGTVTIVAGVATLASGTWPSWSAQGDLWIVDDGYTMRYPVASGPSGATITLADTSVAVAAGTSYTLRRHFYDLPSDFGGMYSDGFTWRRDSVAGNTMITRCGESDLRRTDTILSENLYPTKFAIVPSQTSGTNWAVSFSPVAGQSGFVEYRYRSVPSTFTSGTYAYSDGLHDNTVLAAVIDAGWKIVRDSEEKYGDFMRCLERSVKHDRAMFGPTNLGNGDYERWPTSRHGNGSIADATLFS